jgi:hypothetical protein
VIDGAQRHARRIGRNEHEGEIAALILRGTGTHEAVDVVGEVRAGAPALCAVNDHAVAVKARPRGDGGEVSAHIRLGKAIRKEHLAPGELRQQRALLRLGAVFGDVEAAVEGAVDEGARKKGADARELLDHRHRRDDVGPEATVLLIDGQPAQTHVREFGKEIARPSVRAIPCPHFLPRRLLGDEAAQLRAQRCEFVRRHQSPLNFGLRFSTKARTASARSFVTFDPIS